MHVTRRITRAAVASLILGGLAALGLPFGASAAPGDDPPAEIPALTVVDALSSDAAWSDTNGGRFDLYVPAHLAGEKLPLLIVSNGCEFTCDTGKNLAGITATGPGDETTYSGYFGARGFAVAGISISSAFQYQTPVLIAQVRDHIRYLRAHADEYDIDPNRFAIGGFSSGAWAAAVGALMANADLPEVDAASSPSLLDVSAGVQAFFTYGLPGDLRTLDEDIAPDAFAHDGITSPESALTGCTGGTAPAGLLDPLCVWADLGSPIQYHSADAPPALVMHGGSDNVVSYRQSQELYDTLTADGATVTFQWVGGQGHTGSYPATVAQADRRVQETTDGVAQPVREYAGTAEDPISTELPDMAYVFTFVSAALGGPGGAGDPGDPGDTNGQDLEVVIPEPAEGEFIWSVDGSATVVSLGTAVEDIATDTYHAEGTINDVLVADDRRDNNAWTLLG
jgi:acetyl esterase/lipase